MPPRPRRGDRALRHPMLHVIRAKGDEMADRSLTVTIPEAMYDHLMERAAQAGRTIQEEALVLLAQSLGAPPDLERFWASFGAWQDDESAEATVAAIRRARRSRTDPPAL